MYFTAKSYATMTTAVPTAGSVYGFARHALGPDMGFFAGWMILLDYLLIPAFVYVLIAVAMGTLLPDVSRGIWICILVSFTLACTMHEGTDFHDHARKFGDFDA
jgi:amino acid transporter